MQHEGLGTRNYISRQKHILQECVQRVPWPEPARRSGRGVSDGSRSPDSIDGRLSGSLRPSASVHYGRTDTFRTQQHIPGGRNQSLSRSPMVAAICYCQGPLDSQDVAIPCLCSCETPVLFLSLLLSAAVHASAFKSKSRLPARRAGQFRIRMSDPHPAPGLSRREP